MKIYDSNGMQIKFIRSLTALIYHIYLDMDQEFGDPKQIPSDPKFACFNNAPGTCDIKVRVTKAATAAQSRCPKPRRQKQHREKGR